MRAGPLIGWSVGGALVAAWIGAATIGVQPGPRPATEPRMPAVPDATPDLAEESRRVRAYATLAPAPRPVGRNPFMFGALDADRPEPPRPRADQPEAARSQPAEPAGPRIAVIGIATSSSPEGVPELTAIVSVDGRMRFVKTGDQLLPGVEVGAVEPGAVILREWRVWRSSAP